MKKYSAGVLPVIIITAITILLFWQFFFKGHIPFPGDFMLAWFEPWKSDYSQNGVITIAHKPVSDDIFRQLYPFKVLAMDILKQGELPLWNPYNGAGQPLLATMHVGMLNPLNIIFFVTDNKTAWALQVIFSVFAAGICTYLYARTMSLTKTGSLFAAIAFMLSGFVIVRSMYNDYNYGVLCFPVLLYLIEEYCKNNSRKILFLPLVLFFLSSVVQPQIILYVGIFSLVYFLIRFNVHKPLKVHKLLMLLLLVITGILLTGIQLLPTYELYTYANISTESSRFIIERFLLPFSHFITLIIPNYFGNQATYNYWGAGDYIETIVSVGSIPVFFAFLGLFSGKITKSIKVFFLIASIASIFLATKHFFTDTIYSLPIPLISTGIPSRILFIPAFATAILAGFGIDVWVETKKNKKLIIQTIVTCSVIIIAVLLLTYLLVTNQASCNNPAITNCWNIALRNTMLESAVFASCIVVCILSLYMQQKKVKTGLILSIFILVIGVGFYNAQKFLPFTTREHVMPDHRTVQDLKNTSGYNRVFGYEKYNIKTDLATHYRFYDPNYYDPLYIKRYGELIQFAKNGDLSKQLARSDVEIPDDIHLGNDQRWRRERLFTFVSVNTILYPEFDSYKISKNPDIQRVYIAQKSMVVTSDKENLQLLFSPEFNPTTDATVEKIINVAPTASGTAKITKYTENNVHIEAETTAESLLVLTDNYFPGWKAYIDGNETEILRTNYTFRAVKLPAGKHTVRFSYQPDSLRFGTYMSMSGLVLLMFLSILWPKIRSNKNK